jgi:integrase
MERFLSPAELTALGEAMAASDAAGGNRSATRILRLLALTGARRGEIEQLKWSEVDSDFGCLRLEDSKTGQRIVPIGRVALEVIEAAPKVKGSPFVFPSATDPAKPFGQLQKTWRVVRKAAGLDDVRIHDLRHSFASSGVASGQGLVILGKLLGHADVKTTARYAHLADDPVRAAADQIASSVAGALAGQALR